MSVIEVWFGGGSQSFIFLIWDRGSSPSAFCDRISFTFGLLLMLVWSEPEENIFAFQIRLYIRIKHDRNGLVIRSSSSLEENMFSFRMCKYSLWLRHISNSPQVPNFNLAGEHDVFSTVLFCILVCEYQICLLIFDISRFSPGDPVVKGEIEEVKRSA